MITRIINLFSENIDSIARFLSYATGITLPVVIYWQTTWWGFFLLKCSGALLIGFFGAMGAFMFTRFIASRFTQKSNKHEKANNQ